MWVFNATLRPLYPRERPGTHYIGGWVGLRGGLDGNPHKQEPDKVTAGDSNSSISVTIHNYTHVHMDIISQNERYCHLPKY